ncbi:MAG: TRAP transporter small permease, partial [Alcaligenes sp.]
MHSNAKAAPMAAVSHPPDKPPGAHHVSSVDEIVQSFEEADHHVVSLAGYQPEDWICLAMFWTMALLV